MARAFVDESGSSKNEPLMWVGGWVGEVPTWDAFSDEWDRALAANNPKPIRYFKHSEFRSLTKCFAKFSTTEAAEKAANLARAIANDHAIYGVVYYTSRPYLNAMIEKYAVKPVHQNLKDPFYTGLDCLIGYVIGNQYRMYPNDKVDFIFDGTQGSPTATRVMAQWETIREMLPEPLRSNVGSVIPLRDEDVGPLQAADLFVSQCRLAFLEKGETDPEPLGILRRSGIPMWISIVDEAVIRSTISFHNYGVSTRRLSTIKREKNREEGEAQKQSDESR